MKAFIRDAIAYCTLGNTEDEIVGALDAQPGFPPQTFKFGKETRVRPYGAMSGHKVVGEEEFFARLARIVREAIAKTNLGKAELEACALLIGSTSMNIPCSEAIYRDSPREMLPYIGYGRIGEHLAQECGIGGEVAMFLSACTSSASALLYAQRGIASGRFARAIVLGFEFYNEFTMSGFETLGLLSDEGCRPFDRDREGIMLGEGCAAIVVDSQRIEGTFEMVLAGGENRCDVASPTSHNTDGNMVIVTIEDALRDAGVEPGEVTLIKAHATGSYNNDTAEGNGLNALFSPLPPVIGFKPVLGHTLGGCGAIELALLYFALKAGFIPRCFGFQTPDEALGITPLGAPIGAGEGGIALINHFGFGGNGTSLIFRYGASA